MATKRQEKTRKDTKNEDKRVIGADLTSPERERRPFSQPSLTLRAGRSLDA
jgi:hypothetical protein